MKHDIIFAGVGGQGIISIAAMLAAAAARQGLRAKQNEVHGMAQRGGAVSCHVRISDQEVWSGIIPLASADFILSMEPLEVFRHIEYLSDSGAVISALQPVKNIPYPDENTVISAIKSLERSLVVDAAKIASDLSDPRVVNVALMGALVETMGMLRDSMAEEIRAKFISKGESVVLVNLRAFAAGCLAARNGWAGTMARN